VEKKTIKGLKMNMAMPTVCVQNYVPTWQWF